MLVQKYPGSGRNIFNSICTSKEISALEYFGLLSISRDGRNIRPRPNPYRLLADAGYIYKSDLKPQTKEKVLARRNIAAQILLTFYMAGISVFNSELDQPTDEPLYIASFAARQKDNNNPFGNTRFYGIFCTAQEAFIIYCVDDIGVFFQHELRLFHNFIRTTGIQKTAVIMMGNSTAGIGSSVINAQNTENKSKKKFITDSFAKIFNTNCFTCSLYTDWRCGGADAEVSAYSPLQGGCRPSGNEKKL